MARRLFALAPLILLGACVAGSKYAPPPLPQSQALQAGKFLRSEEASTSAPPARWWDAMGDTVLTDLIDKGLRNAPTIAAAAARVRQSRASITASHAALRPTLGTSALYARANLPSGALGGSSGQIDLFNLGFDAQWEVDLWGEKKRDVERANDQAEAAVAQLADAQVSLSAEIGRNYINLRAREADLELLDQRLRIETEAAEIAQQRFDGGSAARQGVETALQQIEMTKSAHSTTASEIVVLRDSLAVLTGDAPGALDGMVRAETPLPPANVVIGSPTAMLARRPDILVAERRLAASNAQIGIEVAKRFPQVSLMGIIGIGGTSAGDIFDTSQLSTIALPRLSWNFLDFGRTAAAVRGAKASRDAALADYQASVLGALQDAEAALAKFGAARENWTSSKSIAAHSFKFAELQRLRSEAGTLAPTEALDARRQAINARMIEADDRAKVSIAYVTLVKSIGLGWFEPETLSQTIPSTSATH